MRTGLGEQALSASDKGWHVQAEKPICVTDWGLSPRSLSEVASGLCQSCIPNPAAVLAWRQEANWMETRKELWDSRREGRERRNVLLEMHEERGGALEGMGEAFSGETPRAWRGPLVSGGFTVSGTVMWLM